VPAEECPNNRRRGRLSAARLEAAILPASAAVFIPTPDEGFSKQVIHRQDF